MTVCSMTARAAAALGLTATALLFSLRGTPPSAQPSLMLANPQQQVRREVGTFAKLAKSLKPSVVNIAVDKVMRKPGGAQGLPDLFDWPGGQGRPESEPRVHGQGSGVIISSDGYIMTNNHVVADASELKVTLNDGKEMPAKLVGTDPKTDLALVKVDGTGLPAATLGDSDSLEVGEWVMAIGNPFGLDATVTVGVLSGKGRVIGAGPYDDFLQTDASINPGNSGGPLFNTEGQVVGINTAIQANGRGIGFSIPITLAKDIVEQLKASGRVTRGFLGLGAQSLTPKLRDALKVPADTKGAIISQVVTQGPASAAGARVQDVVTAINGQSVSSDRELLSRAARLPVGRDAELTILRDGHQMTLKVRVAERPDEQKVSSQHELPTRPVRASQETLGVNLEPLDQRIAAQLRTEDLKGVVVADVAHGSVAQRAGLQPGDIIRKVNDKNVDNLEEFAQVLEKERQSSSLAFLVERQGTTRFMLIEG